MTLRWCEVRIAFLHLLYSSKSHGGPSCMCSFQLIRAFWGRGGVPSPPKSAAILLALWHPVVSRSFRSLLAVLTRSRLRAISWGLNVQVTQNPSPEITSIVRPNRQGSPGMSFLQRASSCCILDRILYVPIEEMDQCQHPKAVTGVWPFNSGFFFFFLS